MFNGLFTREKVVTDKDYSYLNDFIGRLAVIFPNIKDTLYARRNILKTTHEQQAHLVIKSFQTPHFLNQIVYGTFRKSKARRSYEHSQKLKALGFGTPQAVGYYERQNGLFFTTSFYVSLLSDCKHTINELVLHNNYPEREEILTDLAVFTAKLHEQGIIHLDYSAENILFDRTNGQTHLELVDLNRMRFHPIGLTEGCRNFERLNFDNETLTILAKAYAKARNFDEDICVQNILKMRWHKHKR